MRLSCSIIPRSVESYDSLRCRVRTGPMSRIEARARDRATCHRVPMDASATVETGPQDQQVVRRHRETNRSFPTASSCSALRSTALTSSFVSFEDRQSMRYSTANHHVSSAHDARTSGGRGARAPFTPHWQLPHQAPTMVVHDARAAPKRPAHINHWYGLMRPGTLATAMPLGRAWEGSGT